MGPMETQRPLVDVAACGIGGKGGQIEILGGPWVEHSDRSACQADKQTENISQGWPTPGGSAPRPRESRPSGSKVRSDGLDVSRVGPFWVPGEKWSDPLDAQRVGPYATGGLE